MKIVNVSVTKIVKIKMKRVVGNVSNENDRRVSDNITLYAEKLRSTSSETKGAYVKYFIFQDRQQPVLKKANNRPKHVNQDVWLTAVSVHTIHNHQSLLDHDVILISLPVVRMCLCVEMWSQIFLFCLPYDVVYYVWIVTIFLCYVFDCVHFFIVVLLAYGCSGAHGYG
ncbi:hypothetical protein ANN_14427 [Periplaneta americana]|uniref:Uncharacterized protein n=1 Tax=Periplaneta americana TaxID=6978 RepID=A0ABQ8SXW0_PERAM|nr:hypothetical protein ANN_14427 [Periplaneta americana]